MTRAPLLGGVSLGLLAAVTACTDAQVGTVRCEPGAPVDVRGTIYCLYRPGQRQPTMECPDLVGAPVEISDGSLVCAPGPTLACSLPVEICQLLDGACCPTGADSGLDSGPGPPEDAGPEPMLDAGVLEDAPPIGPMQDTGPPVDAGRDDAGTAAEDMGIPDSGARDAGCEGQLEITGPSAVVDTEIRAPGCGAAEDRSGMPTFTVSNRDCSGGSSAGVSSLVRFDLAGASIPPDWFGATLRLYAEAVEAPGRTSFDVGASRLLRPWDAHQVSWTEARAGEAWARPGIVGGTTDVVVTPRGSFDVLVASVPGWLDCAVGNLVRDQLATPAANHGFLVWEGVSPTVRHITFASTEASDPTHRPRLIFRYPVACTP